MSIGARSIAPEFGKRVHQLPSSNNISSTNRSIRGYVNEDGKRRKLGRRISESAGRGGGNFLTPEIAHTARREAAYREIGALIDAERLATNLLSSMPLAFNLLAPWGHTLEHASGYLLELLPAFTGAAHQLLFEDSPGRGNPKFTGDYTAFDALIRLSDAHGRNGFVAFEIKYSESMREPMPELKPRHEELSEASGLFTDPAGAALRTNPPVRNPIFEARCAGGAAPESSRNLRIT